MPKINLDDVFTAKTEIAADVKETLTKSMTSFGFEIIQTLVGSPQSSCCCNWCSLSDFVTSAES